MTEPGQNATAAAPAAAKAGAGAAAAAVDAATGAARPAPASLFIVERRLPKVNERQLAVLQVALIGAASRLRARGDSVVYLRSIFLARQERLLSLFMAESAEAVRAVNEAALIPFTSIEPAVELPNSGQP